MDRGHSQTMTGLSWQPRRLRQKGPEFKASLGYMGRLYQTFLKGGSGCS